MGSVVIERPMTMARRQAILQAYARGVITELEAIDQLQLKDSHAFYLLLERLCVQEWEALRKDPAPLGIHSDTLQGSVSDGYVNYWLSRNYELEG